MIITVIPAKGKSRRLPNKNMALINGRPMLDYAFEFALASKKNTDIIVSTDDDAIAQYAKDNNIKVVRRPVSLGGDVPLIEVYRHALNEIGSEGVTAVVGLQPDHPDRNISLDEAIEAFEEANADVLESDEADGTHNGAHYIMSIAFLETEKADKIVTIIDDCTNVHHQEDLDRAAENLIRRS
jgi:CMP-N-acetylneuraminic acid synthetase